MSFDKTANPDGLTTFAGIEFDFVDEDQDALFRAGKITPYGVEKPPVDWPPGILEGGPITQSDAENLVNSTQGLLAVGNFAVFVHGHLMMVVRGNINPNHHGVGSTHTKEIPDRNDQIALLAGQYVEHSNHFRDQSGNVTGVVLSPKPTTLGEGTTLGKVAMRTLSKSSIDDTFDPEAAFTSITDVSTSRPVPYALPPNNHGLEVGWEHGVFYNGIITLPSNTMAHPERDDSNPDMNMITPSDEYTNVLLTRPHNFIRLASGELEGEYDTIDEVLLRADKQDHDPGDAPGLCTTEGNCVGYTARNIQNGIATNHIMAHTAVRAHE